MNVTNDIPLSAVHACTYPQPAYATVEEERYAHELRLQLRARLLREAAPETGPWHVGAD